MVWARQLPLIGLLAMVAMVGVTIGQDPFGDTTAEASEHPFVEDPFGQESDPFGQQNDPFGNATTAETDPFGDSEDSASDQDNPFDDATRRRRTTAVATPTAAPSTASREQNTKSSTTYSVDAYSSQELRIRRALKNQTQISFDGETLAEVVDYFKSELGVPIFIDRKALEEQAIDASSDAVAQIEISDVSFRTAIGLMLRDLDLKMLIRDEVLWVTTTEVADETMFTRVYRRNPAWKVTDDQILNAIHAVVDPESWENLGGPGSIAVIGGGLVVRNAFHVHDEIDKLFAKFDRLYAKPANAAYGAG